ncbi:FAD binding domain protein [Talaromyces stipitatus ATCC 10500]|uniref:L-ornithine N(5)-monooxygenase n=1 Tax=Talaromyces stipitatus (strain ATCC 10500 / CBS 375.48 / QM 6759 / NRRL 1006) TaxID=441959 RepID=B8M4J5_TALSN|nr:FAD binding domain protein [Talaromyces stipitatus ATCC 10500]EED19190.1 FAD binding domain protein [Talaromyces stipitatus ATCC 10500]
MSTYNEVFDIIIIGAGPCGLAVAARLREETPSAMFTDEEHQRYHWIKKHQGKMSLARAKTKRLYNAPLAESSYYKTQRCCANDNSRSTYSTLVLDSSGSRWMERWHRAFKALRIEHLRSPMFFHVDPADRDGMLAYTRETGREKELFELSGCVGQELSKHKRKKIRNISQFPREAEINERDRKDYFTPSTSLFADYCNSIIARYGLDNESVPIQRSEVCDITFGEVQGSKDDSKLFTVSTTHGKSFHSRAVVLAVGPGLTKMMPWNLSSDEELGACHSSEVGVKFPSAALARKIENRQTTHVVVVGGGLSSAQFADMAIARGVTKVWHIMRGDLKIKHFDVSLNWVGKFKNYDKAVFWSADDDQERFEMIQTARNGGSITPRYQKILKQLAAKDRVSIHTQTVISSKKFDSGTQTWKIVTDPPIANFPDRIDYVCFATGMKTDANEMGLLQSMNRDYPIESINGLLCLTDDLMWKPDVPLFVTGRLASLRLGPAAPNLEGARLGAERIAWALQDVLGEQTDVDFCGREGEKLQKAFCGLGNRYESLAQCS